KGETVGSGVCEALALAVAVAPGEAVPVGSGDNVRLGAWVGSTGGGVRVDVVQAARAKLTTSSRSGRMIFRRSGRRAGWLDLEPTGPSSPLFPDWVTVRLPWGIKMALARQSR